MRNACKFFGSTLLFLILFSPNSRLKAQGIESINAEMLMTKLQNKDTLYVVNFWATWCAPCVKELHIFNELHENYRLKPVKILLVSLDFPDSYPKRLVSFAVKKHVEPEILWFSETNANEFIPKIAPSWTGSIPATLIAAPLPFGHIFLEGTITLEQMTASIDAILDRMGG